MKKLLQWISRVVGAVLAGLIVFWLTMKPFEPPDPIDPIDNSTIKNPCETVPAYLSELECMPDGFPGASVPLLLEFAAVGPDPRGQIREYLWDYNGQVKTGRRVEFTLVKRGTNIVNLSATNVSGCTVHRQCRILAK